MAVSSSSTLNQDSRFGPEQVLCTAALDVRPARAPALSEENEAYRSLARCLATNPTAMLQTLSDQALRLCRAGSAGVSLLEDQPDGTVLFRWNVLSGACAPHVGGSSPREFSPCGLCLEKNEPILVSRPDRCYAYLSAIDLPIIELLVLPLRTDDRVFGTIWIVSHDPARLFDREDVRVMSGLADMTAAALQMNALVAQVQRSNDDLEQFAYLASHDLKEPLRTVRSHTQLLLRRYHDSLDSEGRTMLAWLDEGTARMDALIRGLLTYANLTHTRPTPSVVDFGKIVESALRNCEALIAETGAEIVTGCLPRAQGDPDQLLHVVQNLLSNALRYRSARPPRVSITGRHEGRFVEIAVADNGVGIAPDHQAQIFGMFKRLSRSDGGSGIGLALCQRVIERHGGRIWVESAPGEGSTFRFTLPA